MGVPPGYPPVACTLAIRQNRKWGDPQKVPLRRGHFLEAAAYRRLLLRLLLVPILALGILALTLAYGFRAVQESARRVDHADRVLAQANNLIKLMVDEETGLRGFLLTRDAIFLQPYNLANQQVEQDFRALFSLLKDSRPDSSRAAHASAVSRLAAKCRQSWGRQCVNDRFAPADVGAKRPDGRHSRDHGRLS